jgi:glucose-6-phosphate-specific signal transduction histidine kinase
MLQSNMGAVSIGGGAVCSFYAYIFLELLSSKLTVMKTKSKSIHNKLSAASSALAFSFFTLTIALMTTVYLRDELACDRYCEIICRQFFR